MSESTEGITLEHCGGSQKSEYRYWYSDMLAIEGSGFLSISDRALLRRFGSLETSRKDFRRVEESRLEVTTNVSRVDGHPLKLSSNLLDRALLRRFPDTASASSSFSCTKQVENSFLSSSASVVPSQPGEDAKERFIGNTKTASICLDARDNILQKPCGFPLKVAESAGSPPTLSSTSVLVTSPPGSTFGLFARIPELGDTSSSWLDW